MQASVYEKRVTTTHHPHQLYLDGLFQVVWRHLSVDGLQGVVAARVDAHQVSEGHVRNVDEFFLTGFSYWEFYNAVL